MISRARLASRSFLLILAVGVVSIACGNAPAPAAPGSTLPPLPPAETRAADAPAAGTAKPDGLPPLPHEEAFDAAPELAIGAGTPPAAVAKAPDDAFAPPPPSSQPTAEERERRTKYDEAAEPKNRDQIHALLRGMSAIGAPIDTKVEGLEKLRPGQDRIVRTLSIAVHRGYCYGLLVRGSFDLNVDLGTRLEVEAPFFEDGGTFAAVYQQTGVLTRFCPQKDGAISVMMMQDHRSPLPAVAHGTLRLQLFREVIGEAELRARADKHQTDQRQSWVRYACGHCNKVMLICKLNGDPDCAGQVRYCMTQGHVTAADCERGDTKDPSPSKTPWDI